MPPVNKKSSLYPSDRIPDGYQIPVPKLTSLGQLDRGPRTQLWPPKTNYTTLWVQSPHNKSLGLGPEIPAQGPDPYIRETLARLYKFSRVLPSRALPHSRRRRSRFAACTCRRRRGRLRPVEYMVRRFFSSCYSSLCTPEDLWCVDLSHTGLSFGVRWPHQMKYSLSSFGGRVVLDACG
jgi:hypothetical protein